MPVFYSLGNLVSAQDEPERILGGLVRVEWDRCGKEDSLEPGEIGRSEPGKPGESGKPGKSGRIRLVSYELLPIVTHQEAGDYSAWLLENYTEEQAARHRLGITKQQLEELCEKLVLLSAPAESSAADLTSASCSRPQMQAARLSQILITGIECGDQIGNYVYERNPGKTAGAEDEKTPGGKLVCFPRVGISRSGTGDVMAAILLSDLVKGARLSDALAHAQRFLSECLQIATDLGLPPEDGIPFELNLREL